jgi:polyhydroxyalkanoate synthesis repressor PhaR
MAEQILFKKYANRRLYDTEKSAYVTLNELAHRIREGRQVKVVDAKTLEDVTALTLTQIILEESRKKNALLPVPLLHLIIQYGENVLGEFFDKYLQQTIQGYLNYKKTHDDHFRKWLEVGMDFSDVAKKTMTGLMPFQSFFDQFASPKDKDQEKNEK